MSTPGTIHFASSYPIFDVKDYPYWTNKMRMHLEAIDKEVWEIVVDGIPTNTTETPPNVVKKNWQLDAKARNIIGDIYTRLSTT